MFLYGLELDSPPATRQDQSTRGENEGEFIATEPNQLFVLDFAGPYGGCAADLKFLQKNSSEKFFKKKSSKQILK